MNKTKIEYGHYCWNFYTGCLHGCPYCWARSTVKRSPERYHQGFKPTFHLDIFNQSFPKKPSRILVCFMGDLWGHWVDHDLHRATIKKAKEHSEHKFIFLTKNPAGYFGPFCMPLFVFPENGWFGVTATNQAELVQRDFGSGAFNLGENKWLSLEPLFGPINEIPSDFKWVVVGAQTNPEKQPKKEWVEEIINKCREQNIPIFLKNNLKWPKKIQEYPF